MKCEEGSLIWTDILEQHRQWKMNMRFGRWHISNLYMAGSQKSV